MSYPSDLSDEQWAKIERFFARPDPRGAREKYPKWRMVEACLYRLREGGRWRALPHDFPPYDTVHDPFSRWQERGVWQEAVAVLNTRWREEQPGRARRAPRHAILDSKRVKIAAEGEARGFHGGKKIKGRSRHVAVDSQGTLLAVHVTAANQADCPQAGTVMAQAKEVCPSLESFTADKGSQRQAEHAAREHLGVDLHVTAKPATQKKACPRRLPLARRAHLRLAGPVSAPLQSIRENRRQRRRVALVHHDALAHPSPRAITPQFLSSTLSKIRQRRRAFHRGGGRG